MVENK